MATEKGVNQLFEFVLIHNDVDTWEKKRNLLRLERLEDLAFLKAEHTVAKKGKCMQHKERGTWEKN